jgi:hypothetical protein
MVRDECRMTTKGAGQVRDGVGWDWDRCGMSAGRVWDGCGMSSRPECGMGAGIGVLLTISCRDVSGSNRYIIVHTKGPHISDSSASGQLSKPIV